MCNRMCVCVCVRVYSVIILFRLIILGFDPLGNNDLIQIT